MCFALKERVSIPSIRNSALTMNVGLGLSSHMKNPIDLISNSGTKLFGRLRLVDIPLGG
jgi:hypothetical protein